MLCGAVHTFECEQFPDVICVWGGISMNGMCDLLEYEGTITAARYQELLTQALPLIENLFCGHNFTFQQDGTSAHTANSTTQFLQDNVPFFIPKEDWPANSPDQGSHFTL